jgi:hypothetical protein
VKASEALILWDSEPQPAVMVVRLGEETIASSLLTYSGGASWQLRREMRGAKQLSCVLADFVVLTTKFGISPKMVHEAFLQIDEYRKALDTSVMALGAFAELA